MLYLVFSLVSGRPALLPPSKGHHVVVELNAPGLTAYKTVLNNVENLKRAMAPDAVEIEVVCHGEGIDLLFSHNNPLSARVLKDSRAGIRFAACRNTLIGRHIHKDRLLPSVKVVDSGVAEVVRLEESGWSYLKGGF
jgi:intracellular sulfur oxidation DsrE/DsrF family protein